MYRLMLQDAEVTEIRELLAGLGGKYADVGNPDFLARLPVIAHDLPRRVREFMNEFRTAERESACMISGYPVDGEMIGLTPGHWNIGQGASRTLDEEMLFTICASLLGDVFAWSTQQGGHLVHDVLPIKGHEHEQLATGSQERIWWHTEDAFSPFRGDYIGLMCLRNPDRIETTIATIENIQWAEQDLDALFGDNYHIIPDMSHLPKTRDVSRIPGEEEALLASAYDRIMAMCDAPQKRPVLFGSRTSPYMCLDPYYMDIEQLGTRPRRALENLIDAIDTAIEPVVLEPGDCCFIDNFRAVHGRNPFEARYDGNDRWLKRLNVTRNLRMSRAARLSAGARVIF